MPWVSSGESPLQLFEIERASAYFVTGGLVAVHSDGRDRHAIWDALEQKQVYATSGRRTLLWFDLLDGGDTLPMGSTTARSDTPRLRALDGDDHGVLVLKTEAARQTQRHLLSRPQIILALGMGPRAVGEEQLARG